MQRTIARTTDVEPGHLRAFEIDEQGAEAVDHSRIPAPEDDRDRSLTEDQDHPRERGRVVAHAIDDTCTHRGCSLGDGKLYGSTVQCACHGSRFDVTSGAVVRGPAEDPVRNYPVHVANGEVQVDL